MAATPDMVCVGHIVQEMIHSPGLIQGPFLGSPPAYCSVAAARQGTSTGLVTKIGAEMPAELLRPFAEAGVDMRGLGNCERTTATELIYDARGNKEIRYPSKAEPIQPRDVPAAYHGCRLIYVCTMDQDVAREDLEEIVVLGQLSAVDLGGYGGVHMSKANRARISTEELALDVSRHCHVVKASEEDAVSIFGRNDPNAAAEKLLACGSEVVLITMGSKGSLVCTADNRWIVPPIPIAAVDTTGGGDTFMAGFLSEYLRSADPLRSARWGSATAACVIEGTGGVRTERMPTKDMVQERMQRHYDG